MESNQDLYWAVDRVVYWPVFWAVVDGDAYVSGSVGRTVSGTVYETVREAVDRAVSLSVRYVAFDDSSHPTLPDFLNEVKRGSL